MSAGSFAGYLSGLDEASLTRLLQARPDVLIEPVPRGFGQLVQRLCGPDSLVAALRRLNRDTIVVGQAIAALGASATVPQIMRLLGAGEPAVRQGVAELCDHGLAWTDSATLCLPERLAAHWSAEVGDGRPVEKIARTVLLDDLRAAAAALGIETDGLRKPDVIARLSERMSDPPAMAAVVARLPRPARSRLDELRHGTVGSYFGYGSHHAHEDLLVSAGLLFRSYGRSELPREVAVAAWLAERDLMLTGRPDVPVAACDAAAVRPAAQAAAQEALRGMTTLLDGAASNPIAALKKGGIGPRERKRLAARLSIPEDVLVLWIDLAHAAGLLGRADAIPPAEAQKARVDAIPPAEAQKARVDSGYVPTDAYERWRAEAPSGRWAALVEAWYRLEHAPLSREIDGDREHPPPLPLASAAGLIRRALLLGARPGLSVHGVGREIDWFAPLHGYPAEQRTARVNAAIREAELLGVVAIDRLTELGEHLLTTAAGVASVSDDGAPIGAWASHASSDEHWDAHAPSELAARCTALLPEAACAVILQSDLTAVVTGQPSMSVSRLLATAAVSEARGTAAVWRFTPASLRAALDAGWRAEDLLAELKSVSNCALPQPLEYLINDVARRHGHVRVRGMRSCVLADEATINEIVHTRSLARLHFSQLAPTVASSPFELDEVLAKLRAAGLSPVAEDAFGAVIVEARQQHQAPAADRQAPARRQSRCSAAELAGLLLADPDGQLGRESEQSETVDLLAQLNPHLDDAELDLLSDAIDREGDVLIAYRDKNGSRSVRLIRPNEVYGRWLDAWCHLRSARREFTIANIESVAPAG